VRLAVFDVTGREIVVLADGVFERGKNSIEWSATSGGESLASGVYFMRMDAGGECDSKSIVLLR